MPSATTNPAQWPSFNNWSTTYAERASQRFNMLEAAVILIQRAFRQRELPRPRMRLYPIVVEGRPRNVQIYLKHIHAHQDSLLDREVCAYEKLDGTNLGVRCDGAVFGRRQQVIGGSYQKVPLEGVLPDTVVMGRLKKALADETGVKYATLQVVVYGELMVNGRYDYDSRKMLRKWFAFGAVIDYSGVGHGGNSEEVVEGHAKVLQQAGYFANNSPETITLRLNEKLQSILEGCGIACVPLLSRGPLRSVCASLKGKMMKNDCEGVVLTANDLISKWKTGQEDESKGHGMLVSISKRYSPIALRLAGIDEDLLSTLINISGNKPPSPPSKEDKLKAKFAARNNKQQLYSDDEMNTALASAMTKYDAPEVFFERDDRNGIIAFLIREVLQDLGAENSEEQRCIRSFVRKVIGSAYGKWKAKQK